MVKQLPKRNEVAQTLTWDLSKIYASSDEFELAFNEVQSELPVLAKLKVL